MTKYIIEDHSQPLFGVSINPYFITGSLLFVTVGGNQATLYTCIDNGQMEKIRTIVDDDPQENYYCCEWTYDKQSFDSIIAIAGYKGVIRIISISTPYESKHLLSHGYAVNQLKFHPKFSEILISASKDQSLRIWNIEKMILLAILSGVDGHRDEVISLDIHHTGSYIVSSGMDHALKIWNLDTAEICNAIDQSSSSSSFDKGDHSSFPTILCHLPAFSTRDIHKNYVDSVVWYGDLIFSKTCENCITCWTIGDISFHEKKLNGLTDCEINLGEHFVKDINFKSHDSRLTPIKLFDVAIPDCDLWYIRMGIDVDKKILSLGNCNGKLYLWELDGKNPLLNKPQILKHNACKSTIRQVAFGPNNHEINRNKEESMDEKKHSNVFSTLIFVCDDSTLWRYDVKIL